jgi:hypothetical protein
MFTAHMRDPQGSPAPAGIEERRMAIYRDLLFNNVRSFLGNSFPVLRKVLGDERWSALVRDYFRAHRAHTPLFPRMPQEFLQYLQEERGQVSGDAPFLAELAHYEWVELALALDPREPDFHGVDEDGDLLGGVPVWNALAMPLTYRFPVQKISPEFTPDAPAGEPTYIVACRDGEDKVGFLELNAVTARLVELLQAGGGRCGRELLEQIAAELRHPESEVVVRGGLDILADMRRRGIVLGTRAAEAG